MDLSRPYIKVLILRIYSIKYRPKWISQRQTKMILAQGQTIAKSKTNSSKIALYRRVSNKKRSYKNYVVS